jgi:hypothetical protein
MVQMRVEGRWLAFTIPVNQVGRFAGIFLLWMEIIVTAFELESRNQKLHGVASSGKKGKNYPRQQKGLR